MQSQRFHVTGRLRHRTGFLLRTAGDLSESLAETALANLKLPLRDAAALLLLNGEPHSQQWLADSLRVNRNAIVQVVDRLEAKGLVVRTINKNNRREHTLITTPKARQICKQIETLSQKLTKKLCEKLSEDEIDHLNTLLLKILEP